MPHQCTGCGHTFEDGSKEMLSGCPSCDGKKFQFLPPGSSRTDESDASTSPEADPQPVGTTTQSSDSDTAGSRVERAASAVRGWVSEDPTTTADPDHSTITGPDEDTEIVAPTDQIVESREDSAQAVARSTVVSREELPETAPDTDSDDGDEEPDLETLRRELNEQFESIKILEPGQYELNLMELFDREERIIAIEEDGRYVIDVPEEWRDQNEA